MTSIRGGPSPQKQAPEAQVISNGFRLLSSPGPNALHEPFGLPEASSLSSSFPGSELRLGYSQGLRMSTKPSEFQLCFHLAHIVGRKPRVRPILGCVDGESQLSARWALIAAHIDRDTKSPLGGGTSCALVRLGKRSQSFSHIPDHDLTSSS